MSSLSARWRDARRYAPTPHELRELAIYTTLLPFAWLPPAACNWAMRAIARFQMRDGRAYRRKTESQLPRALFELLGPTPHEALVAAEMGILRDRLSRLVELARPSRLRIEVRGIERLEAALEHGKGAILWVYVCAGASVVAKRALAEQGHPLMHLSRAGHPFSNQPFGQRFVSPILRRPELRVLKERVEIAPSGPSGALRRLRRALAANEVVSITVTGDANRVTAPPLLGGFLRLPAGPVELAAASGAPLLPVFTFGAPWKPVVAIGEPLPVTSRDRESVAKTHLVAAAWLEQMIRQHPADWWGWQGDSWQTAPGEQCRLPGDQSFEHDITGS